MKKVFGFLVLAAALFAAAAGFWQTLTQIEKKYYDFNATKTALAVDVNASARGIADANATAPDNVDADVDAKIDDFQHLISLLKLHPNEVQNPYNPFYRPDKAQDQLFRLAARIRTNREYGYTLAVERDQAAIDNLRLKRRMYVFFASLSAEWTDIDTETLKKDIRKELDALSKIDIAKVQTRLAQLGRPASSITKALRNNLSQLRMHYFFYRDILGYMLLNPGILHYESLLQRLQMGRLISIINQTPFAADTNLYLRYVKLDLGRLVIFVATILGALLLGFLLYFRVFDLLRRFITRTKDEIDDMLLDNIERTKKPLLLLVIFSGLELGIESLLYPKPLQGNGLMFFIVYLILISYIVIQLIDNIVYHYLVRRKQDTHKSMRRELINLIISIIKAIVVIIAIIILLVRLGVNITGLIASLGIGGLAVALAAKDTLSNFFGLLKILSDNSFSQGDWIEADGIEGTVVEIGFVSTEIRTFDNALITVPNEKLANTALKNWNRRSVGRRIKMHVGVTYGSDRKQLADAIEAIRNMLHEHPGIASPDKYDAHDFRKRYSKERKLVTVEDKYGIKTTLLVYLDKLSDSSIDILVYAFSNTVNWQEWLAVKEDIIFKIWEILEAHDLEFAFPSQSLYFDEENLGESVGPLLASVAQKPNQG